jgi:hypothetical protein
VNGCTSGSYLSANPDIDDELRKYVEDAIAGTIL